MHLHGWSGWPEWLPRSRLDAGFCGAVFAGVSPSAGSVGRAVGYIAASRDQDLCAVPQTVGAVDDNPVARRKARVDREYLSPSRRSKIDGSRRNRIIGADDIDISSRRAALNRVRRQGHDAVQGIYQEPCIDELVRKELVVEIIEIRAQLHRAGRRIDLAVERRNFANCKIGDIGAVVGRDLERRSGVHRRHDFWNIVLRDHENHR